jgi:hypothetical protein
LVPEPTETLSVHEQQRAFLLKNTFWEWGYRGESLYSDLNALPVGQYSCKMYIIGRTVGGDCFMTDPVEDMKVPISFKVYSQHPEDHFPLFVQDPTVVEDLTIPGGLVNKFVKIAFAPQLALSVGAGQTALGTSREIAIEGGVLEWTAVPPAIDPEDLVVWEPGYEGWMPEGTAVLPVDPLDVAGVITFIPSGEAPVFVEPTGEVQNSWVRPDPADSIVADTSSAVEIPLAPQSQARPQIFQVVGDPTLANVEPIPS